MLVPGRRRSTPSSTLPLSLGWVRETPESTTATTTPCPRLSWLRRMGRVKPVVELLDAVWPAVTATDLVARLLSDPAALAEAADGILDEAEQAAIRWATPPRTPRSARWAVADAVLVDEAAGSSEEHTAELQSRGQLVFRTLPAKKKQS